MTPLERVGDAGLVGLTGTQMAELRTFLACSTGPQAQALALNRSESRVHRAVALILRERELEGKGKR